MVAMIRYHLLGIGLLVIKSEEGLIYDLFNEDNEFLVST